MMEIKKKILVTGSNGQLGKELKQIAATFPQFEFLFLSREDMPIHHFELVRNFFKTGQYHYCINCAAYTAVDKAEAERGLAFQVNAEAVGVLAAICAEQDCRFLHISTDYVFDGSSRVPYGEDDPTNPQSVYGFSKREGEIQAMQLNSQVIIIRTSWVYSSFGKNFVKTMVRLMKENETINVVNDQWGSPTYARDLAEVILQIVASGEWHTGIYHFSNEGIITWFEFAMAIRELSGSHCKVCPIPTSEYPTPAKRPAYSVLDKTKICNTYHIPLKNWKESLKDCLKVLSHE
ncbi:MAG TPA: dTDP-4-dehydrorhamnose reductase [Chitinophagaceae bacterium]|nr:dTDP-4-dehydrorhamnose reductase [Chitinophagaceae bacterium]